MHIAIVEDDLATRAQLAEYIQRYTRQYGTTFQVDTFADGDEIAENYRPVYDILFMDIPHNSELRSAPCFDGCGPRNCAVLCFV